MSFHDSDLVGASSLIACQEAINLANGLRLSCKSSVNNPSPGSGYTSSLKVLMDLVAKCINLYHWLYHPLSALFQTRTFNSMGFGINNLYRATFRSSSVAAHVPLNSVLSKKTESKLTSTSSAGRIGSSQLQCMQIRLAVLDLVWLT